MKLDCAYVEDAIWNMARGGHELTADELEHIGHCNSCKQAMTDVESGLAALGLLNPCPPAPDCRDLIMLRINPARPIKSRMRLAWAAVSVAVAAVIFAAFFFPGNRRIEIAKPAPSTASSQHNTHSADHSAHVTAAQKPAQVRPTHIAAVPNRVVPRPVPHRRRHISDTLRNMPSLSAETPKERQPVDAIKSVAPAPQRPPEPDSSVKAVSLTWSPDFGNGEVSYQYSEENCVTGEVTITHTRIMDDSIDVRVESTKAPQKPTSEMIDQSKAIDSGLA